MYAKSVILVCPSHTLSVDGAARWYADAMVQGICISRSGTLLSCVCSSSIKQTKNMFEMDSRFEIGGVASMLEEADVSVCVPLFGLQCMNKNTEVLGRTLYFTKALVTFQPQKTHHC